MTKNTLLVTLAFLLSSITQAQTPAAPPQVGIAAATSQASTPVTAQAAQSAATAQAPQAAQAPVATVTTAPVANHVATTASVAPTEVAPPVDVVKKKLTLKEKAKELWAKIVNFDFSQFNILAKTDKFVKAKKKQNIEAMEGAETGEWKHTKRLPASGKAKEIADKLDKQQADQLKKYDINSY